MTKPFIALLLALAHLPVAEAAKRRAVAHPAAPVVTPTAVAAAATKAAEAALTAGVPAVQIAVVHRGQVIYSQAFGTTNKQSATAATPQSVFRAGSITKQFTAAAIFRLAERGALSLDDRIEKFVPEFDTRGRTITLRHLLAHTSGVARDPYLPTPDFNSRAEPFPREEAIKALNTKPFDFAPGGNWSYSNSGFLLLGYAIESITGKSYAEFIHSEFALPLGLTGTGVCGTNTLPLPTGYGLIEDKWMPLWSFHTSGMVSSGALCSTASDLARWSHLLATGHVVLPASYETMTTRARLENGTAVPSFYGLGAVVVPVFGHPAVSHGGTLRGFTGFILYLPEREMSIAVLSNAFPHPAASDATYVAHMIGKAALGIP